MADYKINVIVDPSRASTGTKKVKDDLDGVAKKARGAQKEITGIGKAANSAASAVKGLFTAAAVFAGVNILRNFGQEMSTVTAITGATGDKFDQLREKAKGLGATTRFSASEAAQGMQFLARAGFDADQVLGSIEGTLTLAQAGALDLASAADIASNVLTGMGLEVDQTARVVDVLALASNRSNTNVRQLGDAFKFVAPIASALGVELEEAGAAIGVLSNAGLQGSTAGTGLRKTLTSLINPSAMTKGIIADLGLTMEQVNPQTQGLSTVLSRLSEAGLTAAQAMQIAGDRGGPALQVLTQNVDGIKTLRTELDGAAGKAKQMADVMDDNLNGSFLAAYSALEAFVIELGDAGLTTAIRTAVDGIALLFRGLAELAPAILAVSTAIGVSLAAGAIPTAITALTRLFFTITGGTTTMAAASLATGGFTTAIRALFLAISTSPLGFFGTALASLIIYITLTSDALSTLYNWFVSLGTFITGIFKVVLDSIQATLAAIGLNLDTVSIAIGLATGAIVLATPAWLALANMILTSMVPAISTLATSLWATLGPALTATIASVKSLAIAFANPKILLITGVITGLAVAMVVLTGNTENAIKVWREWTGATGEAAETTEKAKDEVEDLTDKVKKYKKQIKDQRKEQKAMNLALAQLEDEAGGAGDAVGQLNTNLSSANTTMGSTATSTDGAADSMKKLSDETINADDVVKELVKSLTKIETVLADVAKAWKDLAKEIANAGKASASTAGAMANAASKPSSMGQGSAAECCCCENSGPVPEPGAPGGPPAGSRGGIGGPPAGSRGGIGGTSTSSGGGTSSGRSSGGGGSTFGAFGKNQFGGKKYTVGGGNILRARVQTSVADFAGTYEDLMAANKSAKEQALGAARLALGYDLLNQTIQQQLRDGLISKAEAAAKFTQGLGLVSRGIDDPSIAEKLRAAGDTIFSSLIDQVNVATVDAADFITKQKVAIGGRGKFGIQDIHDQLIARNFDSSENPFEFISLFADSAVDSLTDSTKGIGSATGGISGMNGAINRNTETLEAGLDRYTLAKRNVSDQYRPGLPQATAASGGYGVAGSLFDRMDYSLPSGRGSGAGGVSVSGGITIYANSEEGGRQAALAFQNQLARTARAGARRTG